MFTGIIEAIGTVSQIINNGSDKSFWIDSGKLDLTDLSIGDSVCVNGVCLTAVELSAAGFLMDVSNETLSCSTFDTIKTGDQVNLEMALRPSDRLSGHIVSGHVDGVGQVNKIFEDGSSVRYEIEVPDDLARYICKKGSVCVDGVSLTVNEIENSVFNVNIIPHTSEETIFSNYRIGSRVNLEVDLIARYLESLMRNT